MKNGLSPTHEGEDPREINSFNMYITLAITLLVPSSKEFSSICLSLTIWTNSSLLMTSLAMVKFNLSTNLA